MPGLFYRHQASVRALSNSGHHQRHPLAPRHVPEDPWFQPGGLQLLLNDSGAALRTAHDRH